MIFFFQRGGGSKLPTRMLNLFFSGGKVWGQGGKKGVNQVFKEMGSPRGLGGELTEFQHFAIFDLIELIFQA